MGDDFYSSTKGQIEWHDLGLPKTIRTAFNFGRVRNPKKKMLEELGVWDNVDSG